MKHSKTLLMLLLAFLAIFIYGVGKMFLLRFEGGDVYAVYSSLRADPLGTKAFHDSLRDFHHISVSRNYRSLSKLRDSREPTIFYLGVRAWDLAFVHEDFLGAFEALAVAGGRLVISFSPIGEKVSMGRPWKPTDPRRGTQEEAEDEAEEDKPKPSTGEAEGTKVTQPSSQDTQKENERAPGRDFGRKCCQFVSLPDRWGVRFGFDERFKGGKHGERAQRALGAELPNSISWHSALYFDSLAEPWRVIYARGGHAVIIEREFGRGTIVLSADSYFFSNEALRVERYPELLGWLVGSSTDIVFDETHLGIRENPGVAGLARGYRLHGLFFGTVLLVGLFVWKNSFYFIPPRDGHPLVARNDLTLERDYTVGFVSLLRRNISTREILPICFEEWKKTLLPRNRDLSDKLHTVQKVIYAQSSKSAERRNPVYGYQTIQRILSERK